jgi:hypothetical protein
MSCRCHEHHARCAPSSPARSLDWRHATTTVVFRDRAAVVRLANLRRGTHLGVRAVSLVDLWSAAQLAGDLDALTFDFVGEGGYRPSLNGCPPLAGTLLAHGHLLETGRVEWAPEADLPCAYRVKGLTMLVATPS